MREQKTSGMGDAVGLRAFAPLNRIEAYWQGLRDRTPGGSGLPARTDIDPRGIGQDLHHAFILERIAPDQCRIRVSGSVLSAFLGCEARGLPFSRAFDHTSQPALARAMEDSFRRPATARLTLEVPRRGLRAGAIGEIRLLPLLGQQGNVTHLLGAVGFAGHVTPCARTGKLTGTFLRALRFEIMAQQLKATHIPYLRVLCMDGQTGR